MKNTRNSTLSCVLIMLILFPVLLFLYTLLDVLHFPSFSELLTELDIPLGIALALSAVGAGYYLSYRLRLIVPKETKRFYAFPACFCIFLALVIQSTALSYTHYGPLWCGKPFPIQDTTYSVTCFREMSYDVLDFKTESHYCSLIRLSETTDPEKLERMERILVHATQDPDRSRIVFDGGDVAVLKCEDLPKSICSVFLDPHYLSQSDENALHTVLYYGNESELPIGTRVISIPPKNPDSRYVSFCTTGNSECLYVCIIGENLDYVDISLNETAPLTVDYLTVLPLALLFFVLFYTVRKRRSAPEALSTDGILESDDFVRIPRFLASIWSVLPEIMMLVSLFRYQYTASYWYYEIYTWIMDLFGLLCLCFAVFYLLRRRTARTRQKQTYAYYWLLTALLVWIVVCTASSGHFLELTAGTRYQHEGLITYLYYAGAFVCCTAIRSEKSRNSFLSLFGHAGTLMGLLIILQDWYVTAPYVLKVFTSVRAGTYYNTNHCGYYLTMTIVSLFGLSLYETNRKKRVLYIISMEIQFFALITNNTFGSFLGVILAVPLIYLIYFFSGHRYHYRILLPAAVLLLVSGVQYKIVLNNFSVLGSDVGTIADDPNSMEAGATGSGRFILWKYTFEKILKSPVFGYGPDGLAYDMPDYIRHSRPHNEYLQYAAFFGIPGLLLYLSALVSLAVRRVRQLSRLPSSTLAAAGALIGYLISAFVGNTMFYSAPFFFMLFGLVCSGGSAGLLPAGDHAILEEKTEEAN